MSREDRQEVERRRQTLEALRAKGLISQDAYRATSAAVEADGSQVACGNCGAFSPSEATICFNCGTAFGPATVLAPETRARLFSTTAAKGLALFVAAVGLITGVLGMEIGRAHV